MPLKSCITSLTALPETMELLNYWNCPLEKAMEIINNCFAFFFFPVMLTYHLQTDRNSYMGVKIGANCARMVPELEIHTFSRDGISCILHIEYLLLYKT